MDTQSLHRAVRAHGDFADGILLAEAVLEHGETPAHANGAVALVQALIAPRAPQRNSPATKAAPDEHVVEKAVDVTAAEAAAVRRLQAMCGLSEDYVLRVYLASGKNEATAAALLKD